MFPEAEHRECMRHLAGNFMKKFTGNFFDDNLWPASYTCSEKKHNHHLRAMYAANPLVQKYLEAHHGKLWTRSKFGHTCKVDYVTSNLAESFNAKIKGLKALLVWEIFDKIRQMIMQKMVLRNRIGHVSYAGHLIIPPVIKALHLKCRHYQGTMSYLRRKEHEAEVMYDNGQGGSWRYSLNLRERTCSCLQWQLTGKPCIHVLYFLNVIGGEQGKVYPYVSEYFSVERFQKTYEDNVPALLGKDQWEMVDPGFKLCPPVLTRPPSRPRTNRIRGAAEGGSRKKRKCSRCGGLGHIGRKCSNTMPLGFGDTAAYEADAAAATAQKVAKDAAAEVSARYVCF